MAPGRPRARGPAASRRPVGAPAAGKARQAFSVFGGAVTTWGEANAAARLRDLFAIVEDDTRSLTHGFHAYAARLHPTIARGAIAGWSRPGAVVLDPFCGSGTTLVEAYSAGRKALGGDASPFAVELARTRTSTLGEAGRETLLARAQLIAEQSTERARGRIKPTLPTWSAQERDRFEAHVLLELLGLRELVFAQSEELEPTQPEVGRALRLCLSSLLIKWSREGAAPGMEDEPPRRIGRGVPSRFYFARAQELAHALSDLEAMVPEGTPAPLVRLVDARAYPQQKSRSVDLIVTSPPYAGIYDYARAHELRYRWLGLPIARFRSAQIGARTPEALRGVERAAWQEDNRRFLTEMARVLVPGGRAIVVTGDGVVEGKPEDAAAALVAQAEPLGLVAVAGASEPRPPQDRRLMTLFAGVARREHIVLFRRRDESRTRTAPAT